MKLTSALPRPVLVLSAMLAALAIVLTSARRTPRTEEGELRTNAYVYTGGVTDGKQNGFGICRYSNGNVYTGHWNMAYKEGIGRMEYADGTMEFGRWRRGTLSIPDGRRFKPGERVYGLDVSKYQKNIDWSRLALRASARGLITKQGAYLQPVLFIVVKSTQGTTLRNSYFESQFRGAKRHGIVRGAYHFLSPNSPGEEQARYFIANTPLEAGDMPPVLDLEINPRVMRRDHTRIVRIAKEWLLAVERHYGTKPIIYTYDNYYRDYMHGHGFDDYEFWIANYSNEPRHADCEIWQFSQTGKAEGIGHAVDLNLFRGGDYAAFRRWVAEKGIR